MRPGYLLRRFLILLLNLWVVASLVFLMFRLIPGDPTAMFLDPLLSAETKAEILHRFGLDLPLHQQYLLYMRNLVRGDLAYSFFYNRPVSEIVWTFLPNTLILAFAANLIAYVFVSDQTRQLKLFGGQFFKLNSIFFNVGLLCFLHCSISYDVGFYFYKPAS